MKLEIAERLPSASGAQIQIPRERCISVAKAAFNYTRHPCAEFLLAERARALAFVQCSLLKRRLDKSKLQARRLQHEQLYFECPNYFLSLS
jgi:hypothetical protein